jgi:hypothetical protein
MLYCYRIMLLQSFKELDSFHQFKIEVSSSHLWFIPQKKLCMYNESHFKRYLWSWGHHVIYWIKRASHNLIIHSILTPDLSLELCCNCAYFKILYTKHHKRPLSVRYKEGEIYITECPQIPTINSKNVQWWNLHIGPTLITIEWN